MPTTTTTTTSANKKKRNAADLKDLTTAVKANTLAIAAMSKQVEQAISALKAGGTNSTSGPAKKKQKRPLNANLQFNSFVSGHIREKQPELAQKHVLRKQGELWQSIGPEGQKKFKAFLTEQDIAGKRIKAEDLPMTAFADLNFSLNYATPPVNKAGESM